MIFRTVRTAGFTTIPNAILEDSRIGFRAKGLLCYLLSRPDSWRPRKEQLATVGPDGRSSIDATYGELRDAGYLRVARESLGHGRITSVVYAYENPADNPDYDRDTSESAEMPVESADPPSPEKPSPGEPGSIVSTEVLSTEKDLELKALTPSTPETKRAENPLWDALVACFGTPTTQSERTMIGKAVRELKEAAATTGVPEGVIAAQVPVRFAEARERWDGRTFSPAAMLKHWTSLGVPAPGRGFTEPKGIAAIREARRRRAEREEAGR